MGKDSNIFCLSWMSDGATIYLLPFVNNLVICADVPQIVAGIHDFTDHMDVWGKKDAEYLAGVME